MSRPPANGAHPGLACEVANAFLQSASTFFGSLPPGLEESANGVKGHEGHLAAAATALALAIELFIKAAALRAGRRPRKTHDLHALFLELPEDLVQFVERAYAEECTRLPAGNTTGLEFIITTTPDPPSDAELTELQRRRGHASTVSELLRAEHDAFTSWRYVHEADMPSGVSLIRIEFRRLEVVARIFRDRVLGGASA